MPLFTTETAPRFKTAGTRRNEAEQMMYQLVSSWDKLTEDIKTPGSPIAYGSVSAGYRGAPALIVAPDPASLMAAIGIVKRYERLPHTQETRDALKEVGHYIVTKVVHRLFMEEGPSTNPWAALRESTLKWREDHGFGSHPLMASFDLYHAATSDQAIEEVKTGANPRVVIGGKYFDYPEKWKYFMHMHGGTIGQGAKARIGGKWWNMSGKIVPERPFMPQYDSQFTSGEKDDIQDIFAKHILRLARRTGLDVSD